MVSENTLYTLPDGTSMPRRAKIVNHRACLGWANSESMTAPAVLVVMPSVDVRDAEFENAKRHGTATIQLAINQMPGQNITIGVRSWCSAIPGFRCRFVHNSIGVTLPVVRS
jgi:hypothetical protein